MDKPEIIYVEEFIWSHKTCPDTVNHRILVYSYHHHSYKDITSQKAGKQDYIIFTNNIKEIQVKDAIYIMSELSRKLNGHILMPPHLNLSGNIIQVNVEFFTVDEILLMIDQLKQKYSIQALVDARPNENLILELVKTVNDLRDRVHKVENLLESMLTFKSGK